MQGNGRGFNHYPPAIAFAPARVENSIRTAMGCRRKATRQPESNDELVEFVKYRADSYLGGGPRDGRVLNTMRAIDRASFLAADARWAAYLDEPVDIGFGQTCSQPSMVAFMLDKLEVHPGARVLEVGAGCGYAAAALALLCSPGGSMTAVEILPALATMARANCAVALSGLGPAAVAPVEVLAGDGSAGLPERAPFDRILLSAGVSRHSFKEEPLLEQLSEGGILLYPEARGRLYRLTRRNGGLIRDSWTGVAFVRLRGKNG
jgi:protein-L-isoaspartate(D-aspartate) O-methyltransferase